MKPPVDAPASRQRRPATVSPSRANASSAPASLCPPRETYSSPVGSRDPHGVGRVDHRGGLAGHLPLDLYPARLDQRTGLLAGASQASADKFGVETQPSCHRLRPRSGFVDGGEGLPQCPVRGVVGGDLVHQRQAGGVFQGSQRGVDRTVPGEARREMRGRRRHRMGLGHPSPAVFLAGADFAGAFFATVFLAGAGFAAGFAAGA